MDFKKHLLNLLEYDYWANNNVIVSFAVNKISDEKPLQLFSHILNSQIIWLKRIKKEGNFSDPMQLRSLDECAKLLPDINGKWKDFVNSLEEIKFADKINYKNNKGVEWSSEILDIIIHMINHSTYHRAQISVQIREKNIKPPNTDFIGFSRLKEF